MVTDCHAVPGRLSHVLLEPAAEIAAQRALGLPQVCGLQIVRCYRTRHRPGRTLAVRPLHLSNVCRTRSR